MVRGLEGVKYRIYAILDGCDAAYEKLFRSNCEDIEIIRHDTPIGNKGTYSLQIETLLKQHGARAVLFAEDDYFYLPGSIRSMLDLLERDDVDFITPYDAPDFYENTILHNYPSNIIFHEDRHWRTVASTCLTFMTKNRVLLEAEKPLRSYSKISDFTMWVAITRIKRFNAPCQVLRRAYKHNPFQMIFGKQYNLWAPMPSLATHMVSTHMAPGTDWEKLIRQYM
jgi:hypothetical protein